MQSISTSNWPCHGSTQTKLRAGGVCANAASAHNNINAIRAILFSVHRKAALTRVKFCKSEDERIGDQLDAGV